MNEILKEQSDIAIKNGNVFKGYGGVDANNLSKEQLIMVCNVLFDIKIKLEKELYLLKKYAL